MCLVTWPTCVGLQAFSDMAKQRGWTEDEISTAWKWCQFRQAEINIERATKSDKPSNDDLFYGEPLAAGARR